MDPGLTECPHHEYESREQEIICSDFGMTDGYKEIEHVSYENGGEPQELTLVEEFDQHTGWYASSIYSTL